MDIIGLLPPEREETAPDFNPSQWPTLSKIRDRGFLRVAVLTDIHGLSQLSAGTGRFSGIEVELALLIAQGIFGGSTSMVAIDNVRFSQTLLENRAQVLLNNEVDLVVANYADTPERREQVAFAGPTYLATSHRPIGILEQSPHITSTSDLNGVRVAVIEHATDAKVLREIAPNAKAVYYPTPSACLEAIRRGETPIAFLTHAANVGYLNNSHGDPLEEFELTDRVPLPNEAWRVGLRQDQPDLAKFIDIRVTHIMRERLLKPAFNRWLPTPGPDRTPELGLYRALPSL